MIVRLAAAADAPAIADAYRASFLETFGHLYSDADRDHFLAAKRPEDFADAIADPDCIIAVAEREGQVLGFIKLGPDTLPGDVPDRSIELHHLYLRPEAKGVGAGVALMDWALDEARRQGARAMRLSVFIENHRARRFYERFGFVEVGKNPFRVGDQIDDDRVLRLDL
jgi:ribosomal protein S18 acetylase RimI-like enzyme